MKIRVSEVFRSFQGEGRFTGALSVWVRFFGCNLECNGFAQKCPTDPSTYVLPYQTIDLSSIKRMEDLPVLEYGCDSGYSWSSRFKHLALDYDEVTLAHKVIQMLPDQQWVQPTGNTFDLCFTGGEPMMNQRAMISVLAKVLDMSSGHGQPKRIQIETNGTQKMTEAFERCIVELAEHGIDVAFNISPKLFNVSGEVPERAWKPDVILSYFQLSPESSSLKFVINNDDVAWNEMGALLAELKERGVDLPVYVMPVGGTKEQQEDSAVLAQIANRAIAEGYMVSGRVHANIFGNAMAT